MITLKLNQVCLGKRVVRCRRIPHNMSNSRMHWMTRNKWNQAWKEEVGNAVMMQRREFWKLPLEYAKITIVFFTTRLMDYDGAYNAAKPILDGLKVKDGAGVIIDDSPKYIDLTVKQEKVAHRQEEHVEIQIEKV